MRHRNKIKKLGRTKAHRKATLSAMSTALIAHKRITTTLAKAKALRMYVEPLLNRAKDDSTHNRREVFRHLQDKEAIKTLFDEVGGQIGERNGGYTRVVKLGQRAGDGAEMAIIELVDYNDVKPEGAGGARKTRRTRRAGRRKGDGEAAAPQPQKKAAPVPEEEAGQETLAPENVTPMPEDVVEMEEAPSLEEAPGAEEVKEEPKAAAPEKEEPKAEVPSSEDAPPKEGEDGDEGEKKSS